MFCWFFLVLIWGMEGFCGYRGSVGFFIVVVILGIEKKGRRLVDGNYLSRFFFVC